MTNGKVYHSNVLDVRTLGPVAGNEGDHGPPSPIVGGSGHEDHTPMGLIVASTVAALAVVGLIIVTALYLKR